MVEDYYSPGCFDLDGIDAIKFLKSLVGVGRFVGAYFVVAWPEAEGEILIVEAFRDGQRVARDEVGLSALGPVWLQADCNRSFMLTC